MVTNSTKRKIKLNTYKAVRENIWLNKNNGIHIKSDLPTNIINENDWICQLVEITLENNLHAQNSSKREKLILKWWEN